MRNFERPGRSAAYGTRGMAATSAPLATLAAIDTLRAGGNAADAAVVASAVLCVVEPAMTGVGGDCFALVGTPDGKVSGLNASGRAGLAADAAWPAVALPAPEGAGGFSRARFAAAVLRMVQAAIEVAATERAQQAQRQLEALGRRGMRHRW